MGSIGYIDNLYRYP